MNIRVLLTIRGKVQGVSYRKQTLKKAQELNVSGWVRNLSDGSVQGCFEGAATAVDALLAWCSIGPEPARVESIESDRRLYTGEFTDFQIRHDGVIRGGGCS